MRYWLIEATERSGAFWGFLFRAKKKPTAGEVVEHMNAIGRAIELSGQMVEVARLDPRTVVVRHDATDRSVRGGAARFSIEGDKVDD